MSDGKLTSISPVTIALASVDDPPVTKPMTLEATEDVVAEASLPGSDVDHDPLKFRLTSQPKLGKVELVDAAMGTWRFVPRADVNGDDAFTFNVTDGHTTVPGMVKIHIAAVNDAPVCEALSLKTNEDIAVEGQLRAHDVDGDTLSYAVIAAPQHGRATVDSSSGKVRFMPAADYNGTDAFTVAANDGTVSSEPVTVSVLIAPVNDAPVAKAMRFITDEEHAGARHPHRARRRWRCRDVLDSGASLSTAS